jgi:hypothetical protein
MLTQQTSEGSEARRESEKAADTPGILGDEAGVPPRARRFQTGESAHGPRARTRGWSWGRSLDKIKESGKRFIPTVGQSCGKPFVFSLAVSTG